MWTWSWFSVQFSVDSQSSQRTLRKEHFLSFLPSSTLQCSCLENPRDGGAWWAAVYGVAQSRTRLKRLAAAEGVRVALHSATCPHSGSGWIRKRCFLGFSLTLSPSAKCPWLRNSSHGCTSWSSFLCAAGITRETPNQMIFLRLCSTLLYLLCKLLSLRHWLLGPNWAKGSVPTLKGTPWPLKRVSADSWDLSPLGQALPLLHFEVVQSSIDEENRAESP